jgi:hypothetical protein
MVWCYSFIVCCLICFVFLSSAFCLLSIAYCVLFGFECEALVVQAHVQRLRLESIAIETICTITLI